MMAKILVAALVAAFGRANAGLCVGNCTFLSDSLYCPVNDVREHADINKDVEEISSLLNENPPNYAEAKKVYENGKESCKSSSELRTLKGLAQKDMIQAKYTNLFFFGAKDLHGSIDAMWHNWIWHCLEHTAPCDGKSDAFRKYVINKGLIGVVTAYVTYEMGVAKWKAAQGQTADDDAAYNWDEAAAFHIGRKAVTVTVGGTSAPATLYSPWEFNWKRDSDFPDGVKTHQHALWVFNKGLLKLRGNAYSAEDVENAEKAIYKIYAITAIRSAIKYAWKAYGGGSFVDYYLAEGAMYFRSASGFLFNHDMRVVREVEAIFDLGKTNLTKEDACMVKTLLESMYEYAGISCADVGTYKDAEDCIAEGCSPAGNHTLDNGDSNFLSGCVADTGDGCASSGDSSNSAHVDSAAAVGFSGAVAVAFAMLM